MGRSPDTANDVEAIRKIIDRQFGSLAWDEGREGDWEAFKQDFHAEASLFPSSRPPQRQSVDAFVERMKGLVGNQLRTFKERRLGTDIQVFGNVAIALAGCEITENGEKVSRGVEAILLVRDGDHWKIASQAWDMEREDNPVPPHLAQS